MEIFTLVNPAQNHVVIQRKQKRIFLIVLNAERRDNIQKEFTKMNKISLSQAVKEVIEEDQRTESHSYNWTFFVKVLNKMGYSIIMKFERTMPSPDSIMREWRRYFENQRIKRYKPFKPISLSDKEEFCLHAVRYSPRENPNSQICAGCGKDMMKKVLHEN